MIDRSGDVLAWIRASACIRLCSRARLHSLAGVRDALFREQRRFHHRRGFARFRFRIDRWGQMRFLYDAGYVWCASDTLSRRGASATSDRSPTARDAVCGLA